MIIMTNRGLKKMKFNYLAVTQMMIEGILRSLYFLKEDIILINLCIKNLSISAKMIEINYHF